MERARLEILSVRAAAAKVIRARTRGAVQCSRPCLLRRTRNVLMCDPTVGRQVRWRHGANDGGCCGWYSPLATVVLSLRKDKQLAVACLRGSNRERKTSLRRVESEGGGVVVGTGRSEKAVLR